MEKNEKNRSLHELEVKVARLDERMNTKSAENEAFFERLERRFSEQDARNAKRDAEFANHFVELAERDAELAKRETSNTRWVIGIGIAMTVTVISVVGLILN